LSGLSNVSGASLPAGSQRKWRSANDEIVGRLCQTPTNCPAFHRNALQLFRFSHSFVIRSLANLDAPTETPRY
jgi:hypothetical protein